MRKGWAALLAIMLAATMSLTAKAEVGCRGFAKVLADDVNVRAAPNLVVGMTRKGALVAMGEQHSGGFDPEAYTGMRDVTDVAATTCTVLAVKRDGAIAGGGNYTWGAEGIHDATSIHMDYTSLVVMRRDGTVTVPSGVYGTRYLPGTGSAAGLPDLETLNLLPLEALAISRGAVLHLYPAGTDLGTWAQAA